MDAFECVKFRLIDWILDEIECDRNVNIPQHYDLPWFEHRVPSISHPNRSLKWNILCIVVVHRCCCCWCGVCMLSFIALAWSLLVFFFIFIFCFDFFTAASFLIVVHFRFHTQYWCFTYFAVMFCVGLKTCEKSLRLWSAIKTLAKARRGRRHRRQALKWLRPVERWTHKRINILGGNHQEKVKKKLTQHTYQRHRKKQSKSKCSRKNNSQRRVATEEAKEQKKETKKYNGGIREKNGNDKW